MSNDIVKTSQDLLLNVKTGQDTSREIRDLATIDFTGLQNQLSSDNKKRAFWLNIYNAFSAVLLRKDPSVLKNSVKRLEHFRKKQIVIAGRKLSLDDIEHGLLRKSQVKWARGYLDKLRPGKFEKTFRVERRDPRIHFALNCGGKSCPPIRFFEPGNIDAQLVQATASFLESEVTYDGSTNQLKISRLFKWYIGDFGGKSGIVEFLKIYEIIPRSVKKPKIEYDKYDWEPMTNFA